MSFDPRSSQLMGPYFQYLRWVAVVVVVVLLLGAWQVYKFGGRHVESRLQRYQAEETALQEQLTDLQARNLALQERVAVLERSSQIDTEAYQEVKQNLNQLQSANLELREELAFYRGIVAPADAKTGLRIQSFAAEPSAQAGIYRYRLLLSQVIGNDRMAEGVVHLTLEGRMDGALIRLNLSEVADPDSGSLKYRFRYFQSLEGEIQLPERFLPETVVVEVRPNGKRSAKLERKFSWPT